MDELLSGDPKRVRDNMGVSREGFLYLEELLIKKSGLRATRWMGTSEQLGIFLNAVVTDLPMCKLAERFQRSTESINQTYHKVMHHFLSRSFYVSIIQSASESTPLSDYIQDNQNFFPFFKDAVGTVDGNRIPISPPEGEKAAFRDRKGNLTQNVLAVCNFDMKFTDLLCGYEGSVADSTLWIEGYRLGAVSIPEGKYVLGDVGFPNCDKCLTPYRGVRYYLQEWATANEEPQSKEELFNLRHSEARSGVERVFSILKARFKILTNPRSFKMEAQVRVVAALGVLHNILVNIREEDYLGGQEVECTNEDEENGDELAQKHRAGKGYHITRMEATRSNQRRDDIAEAMWADYLAKQEFPRERVGDQ
jgi:DDE superfamily endonuclease